MALSSISFRTLLLSLLFIACTATGEEQAVLTASVNGVPTDAAERTVEPISVSKEEWRKVLSEERYEVLFEEQTEVCGTSSFNGEKRAGTFICAACYLPLFESSTKFESGTGWPSFYRPIPGHIGTKEDRSFGMERTEYHCARCGGHQGHVFDDGPEPTGLRYCNNGLALEFVPKGETLPALRGGA